jgi:stage II sporulation protein D (peptidoglycan lytic transglycosylase)
MLAAMGLTRCAQPGRVDVVGPALPGEPIVRVRIKAGVGQVVVAGPREARLTAVGAGGTSVIELPTTIQLSAGRWWINNAQRPELGRAMLEIRREDQKALIIDGQAYPGELRLVPVGGNEIDVINLVHLEAYLPGVLKQELYDKWRLATYHAQAIAARSYTIWRMQTAAAGQTFDVEANPATAQAYVGLTTHQQCVRAVLQTTGLVLSEGNRIVPAFYSSTCGGVGMSPTDAFGNDMGFDCLEPKAHPAYCKDSKYFSWGPIYRDLPTLVRRIAGWGESKNLPIKQLATIQAVAVTARNSGGRPTRFTITDAGGRQFTLPADSFRTACNYTVSGQVPLADNVKLKSAYVEVAVRGNQVLFTGGHGFGHGIGLCQFGAEALAEAGKDGEQILAVYYPGAKVQRAY